MTLRHVGIRPENPLALLDFKRKIYLEEFDGGNYRLWTTRMLVSGCDCVITEIRKIQGCIYCPECDEYFALEQWEEV